MPTRAKISVSEQLRKIPPSVRPIVKAARAVVQAAAPRAKEIAYQSARPSSKSAMWKLARYTIDDAPVIGIGTFSKHASLFFFRGSDLHDASELLEGGGKQLRYITLHSVADAQRAQVKRIVKQALKLGGVTR